MMLRLLFLLLISFTTPIHASESECVVVLHGLARTSTSMNLMASHLLKSGFNVANIDYPSREYPIQVLAGLAIEKGLERCRSASLDKIHFVTHSLGGILVRHYLRHTKIDNLGRVVMLGPPNKGSEIVDKLQGTPGFKLLNGPAGLQLGSKPDSLPNSLGAANFEVGIIAGTRSINPILSMLIPSIDDGKVSLQNVRLENEAAFMAVPVSHPYLMKDHQVINYVITFLKTGSFSDAAPEPEFSVGMPSESISCASQQERSC